MNPIVPFGVSKSHLLSSPVKPDSKVKQSALPRVERDFRQDMPLLSFSGLLPARRAKSETPEMDAAQAYVLTHKIDALAGEVSEHLASNGHYWIRIATPPMDPQPDGALDAEGVKMLSRSLGNRALRKHSDKTLGLSKENAALAAQYGALLLMGRPGMIKHIQNSGPFVRMGIRVNSIGYGFYNTKNTGIYEQVIAAMAGVQEWLNTGDVKAQMARLKEKQDGITKLERLKSELMKKQSPTEEDTLTAEERQALANAEKTISELKESLPQGLERLNVPQLSELALGIRPDLAREIDSTIEGVRKIEKMTDSSDTPNAE